MKLIATLACRNNSKRLYGKPMQLLQTRTVLEYIVKGIEASGEVDEIVLAISSKTGNEIFIEEANRLGVRYVLGDDKDVLKRLIDACELGGGDTIYRVTTESPFPYIEGLKKAKTSHEEQHADYTTYSNLPDGSSFEIVSLRALKASHEQGEDRHRSELCTLYMNENRSRFKFNILETPEALQRADYRLTIDFPEDLILCRKIILGLGGDTNYIPFEKIISFLDADPELRKTVANLTDESYIKFFH